MKVKINGTTYNCEWVDGERVYDPPLPEDLSAKFESRFQDMVSTKTVPAIRTSSTFFAGRGSLLDQMDGDAQYTDILVRKAREQGYNPSPGDVFLGQVAENIGDREAWFKQGDSEQTVKKVLERKAARRAERKKNPCRLNPKIAGEIMSHYRASGEVSPKVSDGELHSMVVEKHGSKP